MNAGTVTPPDGADADEADRLRDPQLDALYRDLPAEEPDDTLDRFIRAAAHRAVGDDAIPVARIRPPVTRASWLRRWAVPLSVFGTALLSVSLVLTTLREHPGATQPDDLPPPAQVASPLPPPSPAQAPASALKASPEPQPSTAPGGQVRGPLDASPAQESVPGTSQRRPATQSPSAAAPKPPPIAGSPPISPSPAANLPRPARPVGGQASPGNVELQQQWSPRRSDDAASSGRAAAEPSPAERSLDPAAWLRSIEAQWRRGELESARDALRRFRSAHPTHPVPRPISDALSPGQ